MRIRTWEVSVAPATSCDGYCFVPMEHLAEQSRPEGTSCELVARRWRVLGSLGLIQGSIPASFRVYSPTEFRRKGARMSPQSKRVANAEAVRELVDSAFAARYQDLEAML